MADKPLNMRDTFGANDLSKQLLGLAGSHAVRHDWGGDHAVPTVNTDSADLDGNRNGWGPGSVIFASDSYVYECAVATPGAAVWARIPLMNATTGGALELRYGETLDFVAGGGRPGESHKFLTTGTSTGLAVVAPVMGRITLLDNTTVHANYHVVQRYSNNAGWGAFSYQAVAHRAGGIAVLDGTVAITLDVTTGGEVCLPAVDGGNNLDCVCTGIAAGPATISWACLTEYVVV